MWFKLHVIWQRWKGYSARGSEPGTLNYTLGRRQLRTSLLENLRRLIILRLLVVVRSELQLIAARPWDFGSRTRNAVVLNISWVICLFIFIIFLETHNLFVYLLSHFITKSRFVRAKNQWALLHETWVTWVHHLAITVLFYWSMFIHILKEKYLAFSCAPEGTACFYSWLPFLNLQAFSAQVAKVIFARLTFKNVVEVP